jgi:hypothetical protein
MWLSKVGCKNFILFGLNIYCFMEKFGIVNFFLILIAVYI